MTIKRIDLINLYVIIDKIKDKTFNIYTQYNFLKLQEYINKEREIYLKQQASLIEKFGQKNENGEVVINKDGTVEMKEENIKECEKLLQDINELSIQIPDIFFSLDELKELELTFSELSALKLFIK